MAVKTIESRKNYKDVSKMFPEKILTMKTPAKMGAMNFEVGIIRIMPTRRVTYFVAIYKQKSGKR